MSGPRFIGIRDVVDPYKGLQDSVSKVGDIYRQYNKDIQEADRIRNEEARENERLDMARATHKQQQDKYAEEQRRNEVIRGFDPEKQIENYGIPERFIPEISKRDEQVRDYYSRAPLIAAGSGEVGTQARQQVEESLGTARTAARAEAFDATTAQRQGLDYLISQGVPAGDAVAIVQARTLGQSSIADKEKAIATQVKDENDRAQEVAKLQKDILVAQIRSNKGSTSGSTTSGKTGSSTDVIKENFDDVGIKLEDQKKAAENFKTIIGDGFNSEGFFGWTGNATNAVNSIVASVTELNNDIAAHNENVTLGKTVGELRKFVDFNDAVKWVGGTAKKGSNIKLTSPGELKVFIEDTAKRRDFSEAANKARELDAKKKAGELDGEKKAEGFLTGADIAAFMPQRIAVPPVNQVVLASITSSYAKLFPEVFPKPPSATIPIARPSNTTADGEADSKTDTKSTADGKPNIIGGTLNNASSSGKVSQDTPEDRPTRRGDLLAPSSAGKQEFENYVSNLRSQIDQYPSRGKNWEDRETVYELKRELTEAIKTGKIPEKKKLTSVERLSSIGDLPTTGAGTNTRLPAPVGLTDTIEGKMVPEGNAYSEDHIKRNHPTGEYFIDSIMNLPERSETFDQNAMTEYLNAFNEKGNGIPLPSPVGAEVPPKRPTKALKPDQGVFFDTNEGDPIKAVRNGRVKFVDHMRGIGTSIVVEHDDGTVATYSDYSNTPFTAVGDRVSAGQLLMNASGTHGRTLFTVYDKNRKNLNPLEWLKKNVTNG